MPSATRRRTHRAQEGSKPRYAVAELQPLLQPLLAALFAAFRLPESGENEYLMKAVMRVIAYVGPEARMWLAVQAVVRAASRSLAWPSVLCTRRDCSAAVAAAWVWAMRRSYFTPV
jgi:hypothetical protein